MRRLEWRPQDLVGGQRGNEVMQAESWSTYKANDRC